MPKNNQIWPKIGIFGQFGPGHAGLFNALLVVVARGLYLARHLFTLFVFVFSPENIVRSPLATAIPHGGSRKHGQTISAEERRGPRLAVRSFAIKLIAGRIAGDNLGAGGRWVVG